MSTDNTSQESRAETSTLRREIKGAIRRMAVTLTSGTFWQVAGHLLLDPTKRETREAEVFSGIGFYARPKAGHNTDALVVYPGGAANPVIVATRDEAARKTMATLAEDETAMFNSRAGAVVRANGTVEIRAVGGTPQRTVAGETYRQAEDDMLTAVSDALDLIGQIPGLTVPQLARVTAATGAIAAFKGAASSYLTTVLKAQ